MKLRSLPYLVQIGLLAASYNAVGQLGYVLAVPQPGLRLIWPATGLALAALVLFGLRLWPGVAIGSFTLTVTGIGSVGLAASIALANTLQAVIGASLLRKPGRFRPDLGRLQDALQLVAWAALLSTTVGALGGIGSRCVAGLVPWTEFFNHGLPWWLQNVMANLVVAPLLLTWTSPPLRRWTRRKYAIGAVLLVVLGLAGVVVFGQPFRLANVTYPLTYALFPFLIGAALAFGPRGASAANSVVTAVAVAVAVRHAAALNPAAFHENLVMQQAFLGVMAVTSLVLASAVAERRRVEDSLRRSQLRFRLVWEKSVDGMRLVDANGIILAVNDAYCRMVELGEHQLRGQPFPVAYQVADQAAAMDRFRQAVRQKTLEPHHEREVVLWNGKKVWVERSTSLVQFSDRPPLVLSIFRDGTERKRTQEALRQSMEGYRSLFEANPHPMLVFHLQTLRFLAVNDAAIDHYGYSRDEFLAMTIKDIRPPEDVPRMLEHMASRLPPVVRSGRWRHRKKDGTVIIVQTDSHELRLGGQAARVVLVTDITERLRAEEAIRASEAKYRTLIENLEQSVFLKNAEFAFVAANRNFCEGLDRTEAAVVGRTDFDLYPQRLAEKYRSDDRRVLEEGQGLEVEEQTLIGGRLRTVRVIKTPVKDDQGNSVGVLGIFWDVTEQRSLEAQLRQAQKMEAVGLLAGGVAHDFNNLLTVILGNVALLQSRNLSPESAGQMFLEVERAGRRAAELTQQLLGFSRRSVLRPLPLCLADAVQQAATILRRTIDPRISVEVEADPNLWTVEADPGQMDQVLMNLAINARDAMPGGGVLRIETANVVLDDSFAGSRLEARTGEFVRLRVSDSGHGIPADIRARIFEPFFTTKETGKGTGLGLAMVFGIVKQHQGWIECHSEVNQGTCFDVYLPRSQAEARSAVLPPVPAMPEQGSGTILLVDDEAMIRNLGDQVLRQQGYQVILAESGPEALAIYERERSHIDLVILDLTMPELSGRDTLSRLRQIDPEVRVLLSSGYSAEQVTETEEDGVFGFLSKPYSPRELSAKVRAATQSSPTVRREA